MCVEKKISLKDIWVWVSRKSFQRAKIAGMMRRSYYKFHYEGPFTIRESISFSCQSEVTGLYYVQRMKEKVDRDNNIFPERVEGRRWLATFNDSSCVLMGCVAPATVVTFVPEREHIFVDEELFGEENRGYL